MLLSHLFEGTATAGPRITVNGESGAMFAATTALTAGADNQTMMSNFTTTTESTGARDTPSGDLFQIGFLGDDVENQKLIYTLVVNQPGYSSVVTPRRLEKVGNANLQQQKLTRSYDHIANNVPRTFTPNPHT